MTQKEWVLAQLESGRRLTRMDALLEFGVGRLAARVNELRHDGHDIESDLVTVSKANGDATKVAEYYLPDGEVVA